MVALQYTETKYLLKVSEAANMLGLSVHTVYRLIEQGELQCKRLSVRKSADSCGRNLSDMSTSIDGNRRSHMLTTKGDTYKRRDHGDFENSAEARFISFCKRVN